MARFPKVIGIDPPHNSALEGILSFKSFPDAEKTLRRLEALRQKYLVECDDKGINYCRQVALLGRKRAEIVSRNRKVALSKRKQKREIALWFQVWLETPELFGDWLEMRKAAPSFRQLLDPAEGAAAREV